MPVLIDGHNLLHSVQKTAEDREQITDLTLCRILSRYLKQLSQKGQIIFDGTGPPDKTGFDNIPNLEVLFAGLATDADTVIEHKIKANTAPRRLTVVSSDRRLRDAGRARKAVSLKSEEFWREVIKQVTKKQGPKEPPGKRTGINSGEAELWLEEFGIDED